MMRCGYMILTLLLGLAVVSPALYTAHVLIRGWLPSGDVLYAVSVIGGIEMCFGLFWFFVESGLPKKILLGAKAELDALKAGMRGEK